MFKRARMFGFSAAVLSGFAIYLVGFAFGEFKRNRDRNHLYAQGYQTGFLKAEVKHNMVLRESNKDLDPFAE